MKIFWDIDETLIHSLIREPKNRTATFSFKIGCERFHTFIRPSAKELIEYSRNLVGDENVHILTAATHEYAKRISDMAKWGFKSDDIFSRETVDKYSISMVAMYGTEKIVTRHPYAASTNVLIDNLEPRYNDQKTALMGIKPSTHYFHVQPDYLGYDIPESETIFVASVKKFLDEQFGDKNNITIDA